MDENEIFLEWLALTIANHPEVARTAIQGGSTIRITMADGTETILGRLAEPGPEPVGIGVGAGAAGVCAVCGEPVYIGDARHGVTHNVCPRDMAADEPEEEEGEEEDGIEYVEGEEDDDDGIEYVEGEEV